MDKDHKDYFKYWKLAGYEKGETYSEDYRDCMISNMARTVYRSESGSVVRDPLNRDWCYTEQVVLSKLCISGAKLGFWSHKEGFGSLESARKEIDFVLDVVNRNTFHLPVTKREMEKSVKLGTWDAWVARLAESNTVVELVDLGQSG